MAPPPIGNVDVPAVSRALLCWYDEHRRDLPWRAKPGERPDPYRIWLSEVMLQQTRVETVVPYYHRWLARFPTLGALAAAPADDVMKAWEGLGYYSRARNFHQAAMQVVERFQGRIPDDPASFRSLPGVGPYTAGAVLSIALGRREPVVDGNVRRVFARWTDLAAPAMRDMWTLAGQLIEGCDRAGDLNQAVMELGATVCSPRHPRCSECPVRAYCAAVARGTQDHRPGRVPAKPLPHEFHVVAVVRRAGRLLVGQRFPRGRLGGLWEFPGVQREPDEDASAGAERALRTAVGIEGTAGAALGTVHHRFTHVRVTYEAIACEHKAGAPRGISYQRVAWVRPAELSRYALPVAQRRIAAFL